MARRGLDLPSEASFGDSGATDTTAHYHDKNKPFAKHAEQPALRALVECKTEGKRKPTAANPLSRLLDKGTN